MNNLEALTKAYQLIQERKAFARKWGGHTIEVWENLTREEARLEDEMKAYNQTDDK